MRAVPNPVRRTLKYVIAVAAALCLIVGALAGQAKADTAGSSTPSYTCVVGGVILGSPVPCDYGTGPVSLINEQQLAQGLYAATPAQQQSLSNLENQAVTATLHDHGLPSSQAGAVQSWGRDEAEGELWGILAAAIQTPVASRTADQQNAVDWLTAVDQREAVKSADDAGLEYVKYAGLDQSAYQKLIAGTPTETALANFLSQTPVPYTNGGSATDPSVSTGGYCGYIPPAPYQGDYGDNIYGENAPSTCYAPCQDAFTGCPPPTPSEQDFVTWGAADATSSQYDNEDYALTARDIDLIAGFGAAAVGAAAGVGLSSALSGAALVSSGLAASFFPYLVVPITSVNGAAVAVDAATIAEVAGGATAATIGVIVGVVVAAVAIAVIQGISVVSTAQVPGQLASLIAGADSSTPDLSSMLGNASQAEGLFGLFIGATLPSPRLASCDNSKLIAGATIPQPCLNPTDILPISSSDPHFSVEAKGSSTATQSSTITWHDTQADTDNTARAAGNWFVNKVTASDGLTNTVQSLRIGYTDWSGTEQTAWLVKDGAGRPIFLTAAQPASGAPPLDPKTCVADNECGAGSSIEYVGTNGTDYTATLTPPPAPSGKAPTLELNSYTFNVYSNTYTTTGAFTPASASDTGSVSIDWGDGATTTEDYGPGVTGGVLNFAAGSNGQVTFSAQHDYNGNGTALQATMTVTSQDGQSATASFNPITPGPITVVPYQASLSLPNIPTHTYGDAPFSYTAQINPDNAPPARLFAAGVNPLTGQPVCQIGNQKTGVPNPNVSSPPVDTTATITVLGPGRCTIDAVEPDAAGFVAAPFSSVSFTVNQAPLTVTAQDATATTGSPLPAFTSTLTGLVNGDTATVLTGLSCQATDAAGNALTTTPAPGSYPIACSGATPPNYHVTYKSGTLTVHGAQAITFPAPSGHSYGDKPFTITATGGTSGQPVTFTSGSPDVCTVSSPTSGTDGSGDGIGGATVTLTGAGTCQLTASQAAGNSYTAAPPVTRTFTVAKAPLTITANDTSTVYGSTVPTLGATITGLVNGDASSVVTGLSCGAADSSGKAVTSSAAAGTYPIACSGATAANYTITYQQGTLTIALFAAGDIPVSGGGSGACHLLLNGKGKLTAAGTLSVNGTSGSAMCVNGDATVTAQEITVQGGLLHYHGTINGTVRTQQPATADPLATLPAPTAPGADCPGTACPDGTTANRGHAVSLLPGTYSGAVVANGGGTLCLAPGVYVLNASWTVNSGTVLPDGATGCPAMPAGTTDPGVLLYFASGHLVLNGSAQLTAVRAMDHGPYAGLLYWQVATSSTTLNSTSAFTGGGWYEPNGALVLNGSATLTAPYAAANTITINGSAALDVTSK